MAVMKIKLTGEQLSALKELSKKTGKPVADLVREAITMLVGDTRDKSGVSFRIAKGLWKERSDLPKYRDS